MTKKVEYLEIRVRQLQETINVSNAAKAGLMRERDQALAREAKATRALDLAMRALRPFLAQPSGCGLTVGNLHAARVPAPDGAMEAALRKLIYAAETSGGTAGRDEYLCAAIEDARLAIDAAPKAPIAEGWEDYDFIYDQDDWETTYDAGDASMLLDNLRENGDVHKFSTLRKGQPVFAAYVATLCDEDGEEFEGEWKWFPSKEAAQAAVAALPAPPTTGEQK